MISHVIDLSNYEIVQPKFSWWLVGLSISFAIVATYTALTLNERSKDYSFLNRNTWNFATSLAMAFGIWSMHYMGMIAYLFPTETTFHPGLTVISIFPIILSTYLAFYLINQNEITLKKSIIFSVFMSIGVMTMHNIGMISMQTELLHHMNNTGLLAAFIASFFGFFVLCSFYQHLHKLKYRFVISIIIGLSVSATHYIAKLSMIFYIEKGITLPNVVIFTQDRIYVAAFLTVGLITMAILLISWAIYDYYIMNKSKNIDATTQLPNSHQFQRDNENKEYEQMAVLKFDDLSIINRSFGYHVGDLYLQHVSAIIKKHVDKTIDTFRLTSNEFLLATNTKNDRFRAQLEAIVNDLREPFEHGYLSNHNTGIQAYVSKEQTTGRLIDCLSAVLRCPTIPRDFSLIVYNKDEHSHDLEIEILNSYYRAMEEDEMYILYQPKINGQTGRIVGAEALLRWQHRDLGFLSPADFIPLLEKNQKMGEVTNWVIDKVCAQLKKWNDGNFYLPHFSVNIPGDYLTSPQLMEAVLNSIKTYNLRPEQLELEITETSFVGNLEKGMRAVNLFREQGFNVSLDDFGTGLSSLSYLRQMQISTLKIDKSFVDRVPHSEKDTAIFLAIISLGQSLDLTVVTEGVETAQQVQFINSYLDYPVIQGYYFSKPIAPEVLEENYLYKIV